MRTSIFEFLYDLLDNSEIPVLLLNKELNKFIPNERFQSLQRILLINNEEKGLSVNRLIAFLEGECLIPKKLKFPSWTLTLEIN
ncbi:hypothetical protein GCM10020331_004260 [Ectobacillus funiculus]